jgi:hypothetical protein
MAEDGMDLGAYNTLTRLHALKVRVGWIEPVVCVGPKGSHGLQ